MLVVGIWYAPVVPLAAAGMGIFMLAAQYFHFKVRNPFIKKLPSLILFVLCALIVSATMPSPTDDVGGGLPASSLSFFAYVADYFTSPHMKNEFKRFGMEDLEQVIIALQFLGAVGLLVGLWFQPILTWASLGLALLMLAGLSREKEVKGQPVGLS